jgi:hypothetical protein
LSSTAHCNRYSVNHGGIVIAAAEIVVSPLDLPTGWQTTFELIGI